MLGNTNLTSIMSWKLAEKDKKLPIVFMRRRASPQGFSKIKRK